MSPPSANELTARLPDGAAARFATDVGRAFAGAFDGGHPTDRTRWALAVSGGPDSMAMLALAAAAFPGRVIAATFDHRLRPDSAADAELVAHACRSLDVPHTMLAATAPITGSSLQAQARVARYAALTKWVSRDDVTPLLTAHHADDQAETLLMRLNRGSGLAGLAAIRPWRFAGGVVILRPLLDWRRAELHFVVEAAGLRWVDDPTNTDPRHDRSRIRAALAALPELNPTNLARSAAFLAEAEDAINLVTTIIWRERWHGPDRPFAVADESREVRRRLLRRALADVRAARAIVLPPFSPSSNVESLLDALERGRSAVQGGVHAISTTAGWIFRPAPPRRIN